MMRPCLEILRLEERHRYGTFGVLKLNKAVFCVTLEPPNRLNEPFASCIPAKQYDCYPFESSKFGPTYRVADVPGRDGILFHPGNVLPDTSGCIVLAEHYGKLRGDRAVLNSGETFRRFMGLLSEPNVLTLTIMECF